jgi:diguanylate cyclase (GGDEF)-like protein/PAS domain S-box-containing protein
MRLRNFRFVWRWGCTRLLAQEGQLPWLVLLLGLLMTMALWEHNRRIGQQVHGRIERALMDDVADAIEMKLREDIEMVKGVAGLFNASGQVNREDFRRYYESIDREDNSLDGIQGIGFSRLVAANQRDAVVEEVRSEGFPRFTITPPDRRSIYSAILCLEPFNVRNQRAFGFDMYSEAVRRKAMDRAALSGMPAMSGKVRLRQETDSGIQAGVLIYVPIYFKSMAAIPATPSAYPGTLLGWAYSPIRVGDLVEAALRTVNNRDLPGSGVRVYDGESQAKDRLLYDSMQLKGAPPFTDPQFQKVSVGGHSWLIGIQLNPGQVRANGITNGLWMFALLGMMGSSLAAMVTRLLVNNHLATRAALDTAEKARNEQALHAAVFEASPQAIVVTDQAGRVVSANQSFARITGYTGIELLGRSLGLLKSGRHDAAFYSDLWQEVTERGFWQGEIWNRVRSGEIRRHELSISAVRNSHRELTNYLGMIQDISDRHWAQERGRHRSLHDPLTSLANRTLLMELANQALTVADRHHHGVALLFLDLDGFKPINDRYGHALGDRVLQIVARRVQSTLRRSDTLARLGGDEFVLLVPQCGDLENLWTLAVRIREQVASVEEEVGEALTLSVSIGIARSPDHGVTVGQLMGAADAAMYRAKRMANAPIQVALSESSPEQMFREA